MVTESGRGDDTDSKRRRLEELRALGFRRTAEEQIEYNLLRRRLGGDGGVVQPPNVSQQSTPTTPAENNKEPEQSQATSPEARRERLRNLMEIVGPRKPGESLREYRDRLRRAEAGQIEETKVENKPYEDRDTLLSAIENNPRQKDESGRKYYKRLRRKLREEQTPQPQPTTPTPEPTPQPTTPTPEPTPQPTTPTPEPTPQPTTPQPQQQQSRLMRVLSWISNPLGNALASFASTPLGKLAAKVVGGYGSAFLAHLIIPYNIVRGVAVGIMTGVATANLVELIGHRARQAWEDQIQNAQEVAAQTGRNAEAIVRSAQRKIKALNAVKILSGIAAGVAVGLMSMGGLGAIFGNKSSAAATAAEQKASAAASGAHAPSTRQHLPVWACPKLPHQAKYQTPHLWKAQRA
ncbi:MAG: hypothetical protein QXP42_01560 [Candidatus Micrarchaeia archaeon]